MIVMTKKFTLRPLRKSDARSIMKHINDKTIYHNTLQIPYPYKLKDATGWLARIIPQYRKKQPEQYCIAIEVRDEVVGVVSLEQIQGGHMAELGYWLARKHWRKGIMTDAVAEMVEYGFTELGLVRVYAYVFLHNAGSQAVLKKNGFKKEGMLKKNVMKDGRYRDEYLFAKVK